MKHTVILVKRDFFFLKRMQIYEQLSLTIRSIVGFIRFFRELNSFSEKMVQNQN